MRTVLAAASALPSIFAATVEAQRCSEVSEDGRITVLGPACDEDTGGIAGSPSADVPFAATPDWVNTLRLQIGGVRIADMNGDGRKDIVAATYISQSFPPYTDFHNYIYYNSPTGLPTTPSWTSSDTIHTTDVQIADINNDTFPDIFCANGGSAFTPSRIYWGSATGPSTSPGWNSTISPATWAVAATIFDFDHDGDLDVVTANQGISPNPFRPTYVFTNNAGVLSSTPVALSSELSIQNNVAFADYDHNGWEDLAISKWTNGFQSGINRNSNGVLEPNQFWTRGVSATDKGVDWADVDGNGWVDLAIGCDDGTQVFTNNNGTLTSTWTATLPFNGQQEIQFGDIDGDGDPDLAETHFSDGKTHVYLNRDGVLDSVPTWTYDAGPLGSAIDLGDINGDGRMDLVIGYSGDPSIAVFYGQPPACAADLDGSGSVEINDLLEVINHWGPCPAIPECPGDADGDGIAVDINDLLEVINHWGDCP